MICYCVVPVTLKKYIGMAKEEPFTSDKPDPMTEPGALWFAFGDTSAEAYWNITDEMIRLGLEKDVIFCKAGT